MSEQENQKDRTQMRQGPPGFGRRGRPGEKAKDFKKSVKRLIKELNSFKILIIISLILATGSSILSIFAPNKLSNLTDEISKGLIINKEILENQEIDVTQFNGQINELPEAVQEIYSVSMHGKCFK